MAKESIADLHTRCTVFDEFGSSAIKRMRVSPDSFMQMVRSSLQLCAVSAQELHGPSLSTWFDAA